MVGDREAKHPFGDEWGREAHGRRPTCREFRMQGQVWVIWVILTIDAKGFLYDHNRNNGINGPYDRYGSDAREWHW